MGIFQEQIRVELANKTSSTAKWLDYMCKEVIPERRKDCARDGHKQPRDYFSSQLQLARGYGSSVTVHCAYERLLTQEEIEYKSSFWKGLREPMTI